MNLYQINAEILSCIDSETGEIIDLEKLSSLNLLREEKIESVGTWIKELKAEITAIKAEEESLAERRKAKEHKVNQLSEWLVSALNGEKFETAKVSMSFRKSVSVDVTDETAIPSEYLKEKITVSVDKTAIKAAIKSGIEVAGASLVERSNITIK